MTNGQKSYLKAVSDLRSLHRRQVEQSLGEVHAMQAHEQAIVWLDKIIDMMKRLAAED